MVIRINTYTDESGQDTKWQEFVVCTVICQSKDVELVENKLKTVEERSNKLNKWYKSDNKRRIEYINQLLVNKIFLESTVYFTKFHNKSDYVSLVASHVVKAIKSYSIDPVDIKIFIDKIDKKTLLNIKKEIKLYKIKFSKIRGLNDKSNSIIRLADSICGMIRDLGNPKTQMYIQNYLEKYMKYKKSQAVLAWLPNISIVKRLWLAVSILAAIPKTETFEINYYNILYTL